MRCMSSLLSSLVFLSCIPSDPNDSPLAHLVSLFLSLSDTACPVAAPALMS